MLKRQFPRKTVKLMETFSVYECSLDRLFKYFVCQSVFVFSLNRKRRDQETHSSGCIKLTTLQETTFESPVTPVLTRSACHNYGSLGINSFLYFHCCWALTILNVILYLTITKASDKQHWITMQVWSWFMVLNATFNNISVISWLSVLLVDETKEIHRPVASHWQTLSRNVVSSTTRY